MGRRRRATGRSGSSGCGPTAPAGRSPSRADAARAGADRDERRMRWACPALRVVRGRAPEALAGLPTPDVVFIGGGVTTATGVLDACWDALRPGGRLVANAVTWSRRRCSPPVRARSAASSPGSRWPRAAPVGGFTGWRPAMPVTIWSGGQAMTVHFIGAGPGAVDLLTLRGAGPDRGVAGLPVRRHVRAAGDARASARPGRRPVDTAHLTLAEIVDEMVAAHRPGPRRGPAALRRPVGVLRARRADAPARRGRRAVRPVPRACPPTPRRPPRCGGS